MELDCGIGSFPSSYLGLPLGAPHKAIGVWDLVEERFQKRMASWKMQYISKGGRITLIRNTLSSLPNYQIITYPFFACLKRFALVWRESKDSFYGGEPREEVSSR